MSALLQPEIQPDLFALTAMEHRVLVAMKAITSVDIDAFDEPDAWSHLGHIHEAVNHTTEDGCLFCTLPRHQWQCGTVDFYEMYPAIKSLVERGLVYQVTEYFGAKYPGEELPYKGFNYRYRLIT